MDKREYSTNLFHLLLIAVLWIALALDAISPAKAASPHIVIGWGSNNGGVLNIPPGLTDVTAIEAGGIHSLALKSDGTVVGWGANDFGQITPPPSLADVVAIAAGEYHSLALKGDGTVVGWGANGYGQSTVPSDLTGVVTIAAGGYHNLALKGDGTVVAWGYNYYGQTNVPPDLNGVVSIAAGYFLSLAVKSDGTVVAWGGNIGGEASVPSGLTGVVAVAAGVNHSLALKSDGTVVGWGTNNTGQLNIPSDLTGVVAIAAGHYHSLALQGDGTVVGWGINYGGETSIPSGLTGVVAISTGSHHNLALVPADALSNTAPTANPGGPYLGAVNTNIAFDGSLSSDPDGNPLAYTWEFGDSATGAGALPTHSYTNAGIYSVCLTVNDGSLSSDPACTLAVVYDPSAGFVTGGGWIDSPAGAYKADESLTGKATFGFMSKYQKGASVPIGNTAFQFDLAGLSFASQSYDWLVVNQAGTNAQFKGSGLINGTPDPNNNAYKFMLWAGDGPSGTFRIRIWWEDAAGEHDLYDNNTDQVIGAGNIVIHVK